MQLEVKHSDIGIYAESLDSYFPDDENCFGEWLTISVGIVGKEGADNFNLLVCTPDWLKNGKEVWGRHKLIISNYDGEKIINLIEKKLDELSSGFSGESEADLIRKVARYAHWEFEDYKG